jgi:hypothetical protein
MKSCPSYGEPSWQILLERQVYNMRCKVTITGCMLTMDLKRQTVSHCPTIPFDGLRVITTLANDIDALNLPEIRRR